MCGISVLFQKNGLTEQVYTDFIDSLRKINHRGPDDEGVVCINTKTNDFRIIRTDYTHQGIQKQCPVSEVSLAGYDLFLGHKRLSIVDLSISGHQPMRGGDGSWIVFNGEIYNYVELREELKQHNCQFKTGSDTEVIQEAYRIWGKECLNKFNGMWSICIWDAPHHQLFISNDRFGVKPLYYYEKDFGFILVSETKQFNSFKQFQLALNRKHIEEFTRFGYADINEETMFESVYRFKKAHCFISNPASYSKGDIKTGQVNYFTLRRSEQNTSEKQAIEKFRFLLYDAVKLRMRADVDFGFALSGGLDSSAILYTARNIIRREKQNNELLGFSAIFPGHNEADESHFIKLVAGDLPCKTYYSMAMDDFDFEAFESHVYHQEEPLRGTTFYAQWSIYEKAQEAGIKILFNGQGADEVFAGYHHHFYRYCRQLLMRGKLSEYFSLITQYAELKGIKPLEIHKIVGNELKLSAQIKLGIRKFDHVLLKYWNKIDTLNEMLLRDFDTFLLPTFLRVDDRNSMGFSIESRHPFMDYRLVEFGCSLPNTVLIKNGWQKSIIRKAMYEMPHEIRYRKDKKGFTTPQQTWLETYKNKFEDYLSYNKKVLGVESPSSNKYQNYFLGAWFKVNNF